MADFKKGDFVRVPRTFNAYRVEEVYDSLPYFRAVLVATEVSNEADIGKPLFDKKSYYVKIENIWEFIADTLAILTLAEKKGFTWRLRETANWSKA